MGTLKVFWGSQIETVAVKTGAQWNARRIPARIGRMIQDGAGAVLVEDRLPRTAVLRGGRWYTRRINSGARALRSEGLKGDV